MTITIILLFVALTFSFSALSIIFTLQTIDHARIILRNIAMDSISVWTSGHMASVNLDRERDKSELIQGYKTAQLDLYRQQGKLNVIQQSGKIRQGQRSERDQSDVYRE